MGLAVLTAAFFGRLCGAVSTPTLSATSRRLSSQFQTAKLTASDGAAEGEFGFSVAIDGNLIVVGSKRDDHAGEHSGSAHVFQDDGTTWTFMQKLTASDAAEGDEFGINVAIDGKLIVVGAWHDDHAGFVSGAAYVFRSSNGGTTWTEMQKLTAREAEGG